ncbi:MAG: nitroreductase family protein [Bacteroidetes bacterium]|nr:nitroreductase family protein [Bacteroidota bacterium]
MKKPAITKYNINPLIKERWSPRAFDNKEVEADKIHNVLEAARWAPSAFNEQPWRYIIGKKGTKTWQLIFDSLIDFNKTWAEPADVLVVVVGKKTLTSNSKENETYKYDVGQSVATMTVQATNEGLVMHQMGGFSKQKNIEAFNIPDDYEVIAAFALGYIGNVDQLPENFRNMETNPRQRKPFSEFVFEENFGQKSTLISD